MIKIILVEEHSIIRNGIKLLLESQESLRVVAEASNGREVLSYLENNVIPDIIITDVNMPGKEGIELAVELSQNYPSVKVIILSMLNENYNVLYAFEKGVKGYLIKSVGYDELHFAINHIHKGGIYLCGEMTKIVLDKLRNNPFFQNPINQGDKNYDISDREMEVLQYISDGYTNLEIADKMFLSKRTVEGHRQNLIDKIGVKNSASLIKFAVKQGLIS
ncbi:response regulator transcription factor [Sphingobacterium hungaricum]|uniref:DNA-binding response regulator n=1 Tax=Sphingobacterium hungaricum TaxID=2082723 RepID=A0A928UY42_9SPHI|nr:response regulator transcription factor [Sphingobacterium hungaricum]MBE8715148.1 DNA-binding response regulator [Sphingobacterium hungaricum]